jgi:hypothetical protein
LRRAFDAIGVSTPQGGACPPHSHHIFVLQSFGRVRACFSSICHRIAERFLTGYTLLLLFLSSPQKWVPPSFDLFLAKEGWVGTSLNRSIFCSLVSVPMLGAPGLDFQTWDSTNVGCSTLIHPPMPRAPSFRLFSGERVGVHVPQPIDILFPGLSPNAGCPRSGFSDLG